jgi:DNA invertase Pin-like site-specific DNA recombinase
MQPRFIAYRRVSTIEQGKSGLGLEAQAAAIARVIADRGGRLLEDFEEVETGKGADALDRRPVLARALKAAKAKKATLVVSRLDRLSRNLHFVSGLIDQAVDLLVADMPQEVAPVVQTVSGVC